MDPVGNLSGYQSPHSRSAIYSCLSDYVELDSHRRHRWHGVAESTPPYHFAMLYLDHIALKLDGRHNL